VATPTSFNSIRSALLVLKRSLLCHRRSKATNFSKVCFYPCHPTFLRWVGRRSLAHKRALPCPLVFAARILPTLTWRDARGSMARMSFRFLFPLKVKPSRFARWS